VLVIAVSLVLLLGAGSTPLTIRVVTDDGKPVEGASVLVVHGGAIGPSGGLKMKEPIAVGVVGPDGRFRIKAAPIDEVFTVIATAEGFARAHRCLLYEGGDPVEEVVIRLASAGRIRGVVTGPDGKPVAGANVYAIPATGPVSALRLRPATARVLVMDSDGETDFILAERAVTDETGRYSIPTVPLGRKMAVRAEAEGFPPTKWVEPIEVTKEKPAVDLALGFARAVRLTVVVRSTEGEPLSDARVGLIGLAERQTTDDAGRAVFPVVAPGAWEVRVWKRGWLTNSLPTTIPDDAERHRVGVVLSAGISAEGIVVDERGEPVPGAWVTIWPKKTGSGRKAKTDAEGRFTVRSLREGPHGFEVRRKGHEVEVEAEGFLTIERPFEMGAEDREIEIVLETGGVIRGEVVTADGKPLEGHLGLRILDGDGEDRSEEDYTEEDGTFAARVPPGVYRIEIHDNLDEEKIYASKDGVTVTPGAETAVRLTLPE
jgi:uncharacterized GH25 family protein